MNTTELAWAAGFFDAEGSVVLRQQRHAWRMELEATQGGDHRPLVLLRLHAAFSGLGTISGPRRGYPYYWRASSHADVKSVATRLGPWISEPKRSAIESASQRVHRAIALAAQADRSGETELAWAAGLFGGDGTTSAGLDTSTGPEYRRLKVGLPQAAVNGGVPPVLLRFQEAVGGAGSVGGPYVLKNPWSRLPQYVWSLSGSRGAERVLELIWPWLDEAKRQQARVAIVAAREGGPHRPLPLPSAAFGLS